MLRVGLDQVTRLSGLLAEVWETLADPSAVQAGKPRVLAFPDCPAVASPRGLQNLYEHLEVRKGRQVFADTSLSEKITG